MAKKITINGSNLLSALTDDWGGQNNTESTQTIHGTEVPVGAEWGMNRGEVERYVKSVLTSHKQQIEAKYGYIHIPNSKSQDGFYHIYFGRF